MGVTAKGEIRALNGMLNAVHVALHSGDPEAGNNEVTGGAYARKAYPYTLSGANPTIAANSALIAYEAATTDWGTVTHFGIWSAAVGGDLLVTGVLDNPRTIFTDDVLRFPIGALKFEAN